MKHESLFDDNYSGPEALRLHSQYKASFDELVEALEPVWSGKTVAHYCYRAPQPLHVLSGDSFEITINVGCQPHIPTGVDLQDSCRVNHITVDLWDSADVQGFIELLLRRLKASLALFSLGSPWVAGMPSGSVDDEN